ncbi:N-acetylmuramoyl-L-alanine amidase [Candidatus Sumerlaeota bacterium]|nr:N-acetylmuramoyl-L-alanine amidase [Candidatus Sumerlaeota bacterium]
MRKEIVRMARSLIGALAALVATATLAQPIEFPDAERPFRPEGDPLRGLVITIDPGHGGSSSQPGYAGSARGVRSGVVEGDLNMRVAGLLYYHLRNAGARVTITRRDDRRVTLGETERAEELGARVEAAEETRSHLFLSLHHNSAPRRSANGVVSMIWPTDSNGEDQPLERAFAEIMRQEVQALVPHREEFPHYLLEHPLVMDSDIPSVVIEFGFLSNAEFDAWVSQPGSNIVEARAAYSGVARMWAEHREELEALRDRLFPATERERPEGPPRGDRRGGLARQYWPFDRAPETPEEAEHAIDMYQRSELSDRTFFYLEADVDRTDEGWRVSGATNHAFVRSAVEGLLEDMGCEPLVNDIEMLPSSRLGEERYGIVQIPMALTFFSPRLGGTPATQLLLGERVWLLDVSEDGEQLLHMASDGYIGWVRRDAIRRMGSEEFAQWQVARRARVIHDTLVDDLRLPAGCALPLLGVDRRTATLRLPVGVEATDGAEEIEVPRSALALPAEESPGRVAALTATEFLGTPYVFGARSMMGIDCSGLSGVAYQANGVRLPRDARQQILVGELVATPWHLGALQPGDLLFFCSPSGRISHEAVSLGGMRFIHASMPMVHVASLDPDDPLFREDLLRRFAFARRVVE